jgi:hypothetical protein
MEKTTFNTKSPFESSLPKEIEAELRSYLSFHEIVYVTSTSRNLQKKFNRSEALVKAKELFTQALKKVKRHPLDLKTLSFELRCIKQIVIAAVSGDPKAIRFVPRNLRTDPDVIAAATTLEDE